MLLLYLGSIDWSSFTDALWKIDLLMERVPFKYERILAIVFRMIRVKYEYCGLISIDYI